jgi:hypothetical protein
MLIKRKIIKRLLTSWRINITVIVDPFLNKK